jgi:hypothetical protein
VVIAFGWFAWTYIPEAREMMQQAYVVMRDFIAHAKTQLLIE